MVLISANNYEKNANRSLILYMLNKLVKIIIRWHLWQQPIVMIKREWNASNIIFENIDYYCNLLLLPKISGWSLSARVRDLQGVLWYDRCLLIFNDTFYLLLGSTEVRYYFFCEHIYPFGLVRASVCCDNFCKPQINVYLKLLDSLFCAWYNK